MSRGRRFLQSALETASLLVATDGSSGVGSRAVWSQQQRWMARATKKKHPVELLQVCEKIGLERVAFFDYLLGWIVSDSVSGNLSFMRALIAAITF